MTTAASAFGKVAVLLGGESAEREISLQTGSAVHAALVRKGVDAHAIDATGDFLARLATREFDRVFIALHGRGGEDGVIQGALDAMHIPYTGSRVLGSALSMDKARTKWIWRSRGLRTPDFVEIETAADLERVREELGFPVFVKPVHEGSSCGAAKVESAAALRPAWEAAGRFDARVMAERWIDGAEYTASILAGEALPLIRIETPRVFYDYEAKYLEDTTRYHCPCGLGEGDEQRLRAVALAAFDAVGASGWGRVDFLLDASGVEWLIEVNTVPGMTSHSLVPMAAKQAGIDFDSLTLRILETSMTPAQMPVQRRAAS